MRILITAGGTLEKIDEVRNIKNSASGRLAQVISDLIPEEIVLDYVHGKGSLLPSRPSNLYEIEGVQDLDDRVSELLETHKYDAVIFSAAVSDYMITSVSTPSTIARKIDAANIEASLTTYPEDLDRTSKIRSSHDDLVVFMKKAPKVIQKVKQIQKDTILIGFKLLVDADDKTLIEVGLESLLKNKADYVIANDLTQIKGDKHRALFLNQDGVLKTLETKQDIAQEIIERLIV